MFISLLHLLQVIVEVKRKERKDKYQASTTNLDQKASVQFIIRVV